MSTFSLSESSLKPSYDAFLDGLNGAFIEELYQCYLRTPDLVDPSWRFFFQSLQEERAVGQDAPLISQNSSLPYSDVRALWDVYRLMAYYRTYGHIHAQVDPLKREAVPPVPTWEHLEAQQMIRAEDIPPSLRGSIPFPLTSHDLQRWLEATYCGPIGHEWAHIADPKIQERWVEHIEKSPSPLTLEEHLRCYETLVRATAFEHFLHIKYPAVKRFGLEGGEGLMVALAQVLDYAHHTSMRRIVLGMPHRGRLNVLAHILQKPYDHIFAELKGLAPHDPPEGWSGDVKYHMGATCIHRHQDHDLHITMPYNPSHLESVNPVVLGLSRAFQDHDGDAAGLHTLPILIHGDASFAGQGIVSETLQMSALQGYHTGGTLHFITNNQVGFTADPEDYRSGRYCTDIARSLDIPILHVNGDDVTAIVHATRMACFFRQNFHKDVVIDIVCYRQNGHNETDEPAFTQPTMYRAIGNQPSVTELYRQNLISMVASTERENDNDDVLKEIEQHTHLTLQKAFEQSSSHQHAPSHRHVPGPWDEIPLTYDQEVSETGVNLHVLQKLGAQLCTWPDAFQAHSKIKKQYEARLRMIQGDEPTDWATGEMLALASLVHEHKNIRLSGQDAERGTFSHRHAVLHDQESGVLYAPLKDLKASGKFQVWNSLLSEFGALGFEYGYSLADPHTLTIWEAQFGDFANGAQVIIDQYISASQSKWGILSALTLLLPHGFEGQGPEHSSARLERFLQMSACHNWSVVNCSTPANFFHVLRRQLVSTTRRPLIVMSPKSLLRHKSAVSPLSDYDHGTRFQKVLCETDERVIADQVQRVVLCTGKVYYDLKEAQLKQERWDIALLRCEQLYPFPDHEIHALWARYPQAVWIWCQEEPQNMGAWSFVENQWRHLSESPHPLLHYVGRPPAASPATGYTQRHKEEQQHMIHHIFETEMRSASS